MAETEDYLQITSPALTDSLIGVFHDIRQKAFGLHENFQIDYSSVLLSGPCDTQENYSLSCVELFVRHGLMYFLENGWKSSKVTTEYFQQSANRYQTEQQLELIENKKAIELATMERIKVTQTRNHVESTMEVHCQITENIVEFSQKQNMFSKNITLESEEKQDDNRKRSGYDLYEEKSKRVEIQSLSLPQTKIRRRILENETRTLNSGRRVEEVIYEFARKLEFAYLHSFIVNESDAHTKPLFSKEEWKEINTSEVEDRLELEYSLKELLKKYTVDDVEKLREILF
ncbi:12292_t:CDS:2 [Dentiscutata erythropus]|uniref:12292_t:CDS:1 n=1 Tax=Dentiscutata erythropus TaxID=1348616 RepID=A0A9N8ZYB5_9GLOM|nr:12292_t:CDS:2 [Dentiscutata erythropus]